MKVGVVINPRKARDRVDAFRHALRERAVATELFEGDDTPAQAEAACARGCDAIVSAGGDGTFRGLLDVAVGRGVPVAPLPLGTSNDYAKALGLRTVDDVAEAVGARRIRWQDAGRAEYVDLAGRPVAGWFSSTAGVGLLADVFDLERTAWVEAGRRLLGDGMYPLLTTISAFRTRSVPGALDLDGRSARRVLRLFEISKVKEAGGLAFTPEARPDDGVFRAWALEDAGLVSTLAAFVLAAAGSPRFFDRAGIVHFGRPDGAPAFTEARLEPDEVQGVHLNGDLVGRTPALFTLVPRALPTFVGPGNGR